jgi:hypothetical protein
LEHNLQDLCRHHLMTPYIMDIQIQITIFYRTSLFGNGGDIILY